MSRPPIAPGSGPYPVGYKDRLRNKPIPMTLAIQEWREDQHALGLRLCQSIAERVDRGDVSVLGPVDHFDFAPRKVVGGRPGRSKKWMAA